MKKILFITIVANTLSFAAYAQKNNSKQSATVEFSSTDSIVKTQLGDLLAAYYQLKDDLVSSNEKAASASAKAFEAVLEKVQTDKVTVEQRKFYLPISEDLAYDAKHIKNAPNIDHMREHFSSFSNNMWLIAKAFKATNGNAVYQDYCPMQKAYWLSKDEAIKNPYYGKQMLTCGSVKETIK